MMKIGCLLIKTVFLLKLALLGQFKPNGPRSACRKCTQVARGQSEARKGSSCVTHQHAKQIVKSGVYERGAHPTKFDLTRCVRRSELVTCLLTWPN